MDTIVAYKDAALSNASSGASTAPTTLKTEIESACDAIHAAKYDTAITNDNYSTASSVVSNARALVDTFDAAAGNTVAGTGIAPTQYGYLTDAEAAIEAYDAAKKILDASETETAIKGINTGITNTATTKEAVETALRDAYTQANVRALNYAIGTATATTNLATVTLDPATDVNMTSEKTTGLANPDVITFTK